MGKMKQVTHGQMLDLAQADAGFGQFVDSVSPRKNGVQPVFFSELFLVLKILWEIYSILKRLGFFSKWLTVYRVKQAMKKQRPEEQERALQAIVNGFAK